MVVIYILLLNEITVSSPSKVFEKAFFFIFRRFSNSLAGIWSFSVTLFRFKKSGVVKIAQHFSISISASWWQGDHARTRR